MNNYNSEAKARFGNTQAYKEFRSKTAGYTEEDFANSEKSLHAIFEKFAQCKAQGNEPDSPMAQDLVKELQSLITKNFYTCTAEILKGLGIMYTADERFRQNIDKHGEGTTEFISKYITVYCK